MQEINRKQLVIAMDHARAMGAVAGLVDAGHVIDTVIEAGADAIMTSFGTVKRYRERMIGRVPVYLRLDGGVSLIQEKWLENTEWKLLHTLDDAQDLGCEGVCLMYFMGAPCELATLEIVAEVASEALEDEVPVMVEALPCPHTAIPDTLDPQMMADACRIAFEHGADILKTYYTGSPEGFRTVVEAVPAPVLIAGGPKVDSDLAVLRMVGDVISAGGKGVVFGRNIWQHANPAGMVRALRAVIHENAAAEEAQELLRS
jgi:DhnA family fructose-bisphosphate aldolase class Ia